jgi:LacI family transcriptional regulator/LacI family repressor for deo operon, udp, cdd, tsx, nupC, and nupG
MANKRVTQQDIAAKLGLHRSTVSLGLRNHPSIQLATRQKIIALAESLGYRPDPMLSALAAYREGNRSAAYGGTLAWLYSSANGFSLKNAPLYQLYFQGAQEQAERRGYKLEVFDMNGPDMTPRRVSSIFHARNIQGILVCPQPTDAAEIHMDWSDFSAVTFGYTLKNPNLHKITATQFRGISLILDKLRGMGYQRIGFALTEQVDRRSDHNYLAAYINDAYRHGGGRDIPPFTAEYGENPQALGRWIKRHQIEVVVSTDKEMLSKLKGLGMAVPQDIGFASCSLESVDSEVSGLCENSLEIGTVAVDFLIAMIHRGERGLPAHTQHILVEGTWVGGTTVQHSAKA